mmetsp:Transcript_13399/g.28755  ORF Transcript_13399/g.28755 Transcript_13399/m.28755 type:complete len:224 (+) Transcript_13399:644-1315(+)
MSGSLRYFFSLRTTMSGSLDFNLSTRSRTPVDLSTDLQGWRLERLTQLQLLSAKVAESSRRIFLISASVGAFSLGGGGCAMNESLNESLDEYRLKRRFSFVDFFFFLPRCLREGSFGKESKRPPSSEDRSESLDEEEELPLLLLLLLLLLLDDEEDELEEEDEEEELEEEELDEEDEELLHVLLSESLPSLSVSMRPRSEAFLRWRFSHLGASPPSIPSIFTG